jgi:hypothetical protein
MNWNDYAKLKIKCDECTHWDSCHRCRTREQIETFENYEEGSYANSRRSKENSGYD